MSQPEVFDLDDGGLAPKKKPVREQKAVKPASPEGSPKDRLASLLENVPAQSDESTYNSCLLPSGKEILIRSAYFDDERNALNLARSQKMPYIEALAKLVTKGVDYNELPYFDHIYILLKVREFSFGSSYPIEHNCWKCEETNNLTVDINNLKVDRVDVPLHSLTVKVDLPIAKKRVTARIPRISESIETGMEFLVNYIISVEEETDKYILKAFIEALPLRDAETIKKAITPDYGVDPTVNFNCNKCKTLNTITLPISADFFTLS